MSWLSGLCTDSSVNFISLSRYISLNFTKAFLTIFLPLFFIGSLVFIVKLASLTSLFQVNFIEMMQLFSYNVPMILFYTLPISFLVAVATTLLKLSNENELIALVALGIESKQILSQLKIIALLFSIVLLALSLAKIPQSNQLYKSFKTKKSTQAQLNLNPSQLGQKFGDFFIYIRDKQGEMMQDMVIYTKGDLTDKEGNQSRLSNQLFIAKKAHLQTQNATIKLTLIDGNGYSFGERSLKEINYEKMQIFQDLHSDGYSYKSILEQWLRWSKHPSKKRRILFYIFISLIPMIGLYIIASFAIINPRYQKSYAYQVLGITTVAFYVIATSLKNSGSFAIMGIAIVAIFALGWLLFRYKVSRFF